MQNFMHDIEFKKSFKMVLKIIMFSGKIFKLFMHSAFGKCSKFACHTVKFFQDYCLFFVLRSFCTFTLDFFPDFQLFLDSRVVFYVYGSSSDIKIPYSYTGVVKVHYIINFIFYGTLMRFIKYSCQFIQGI